MHFTSMLKFKINNDIITKHSLTSEFRVVTGQFVIDTPQKLKQKIEMVTISTVSYLTSFGRQKVIGWFLTHHYLILG